jgi:hypothetical protein
MGMWRRYAPPHTHNDTNSYHPFFSEELNVPSY